MAKHENPKKGISQLKQYPVLLLFFGFLLAMFVADCITPFKSYSELENTTYQKRPSLTVSDLTGRDPVKKINAFFLDYSDFFKQQIAGRDLWINLHAACEQLVFQKLDYGNMVLGEDGMEFTRTYGLTTAQPDEAATLEKNLTAVEGFGQRYPGKVTAMVVPSAATIYPEKTHNAPLMDENAYLDAFADRLSGSVTVMDVRDALTAHKAESIYYNTDHHWTTTGAFYAYEALCGQLGLPVFDRAAHTAVTVEDFYGTSWSKSRRPFAKADSITYYDLDNSLTLYNVKGKGEYEVKQTTGLYDTYKFNPEVYDKYSAFLHGNNGYSRIDGDGQGSILVVKDSYANSFVPFLTASYDTIDVIDFRSYNYGLDSLMAENNYDQVLVLYSFASFKSDPYLVKLAYEG